MSRFSHIYVEEEILEKERTKEVLSHFPKATIVPIKHYKDVFNRRLQNVSLQSENQNLILAEKKGRLIYPGAPVCQSFGEEHFYYTSCMMNCLFDCEYCYLKGMYPSGHIVVFLNIEDVFSELSYLLEEHPVYLCISYDTDMLSMNEIFPYAELWAHFIKEHKNLRIEVRTKSGSLSFWKKIKDVFVKDKFLDERQSDLEEAMQRFIFAFTISPEYIIREYEHRTGSLGSRLRSVRAGLALGFPVRLCFDPMIYCVDWRAQYEAMLREVFRQVPMEALRDLSVGTFRMSESYLKNMRKAFPRSAVVQYPYENDEGVYHYSEKLTEEMEGFLIDLLLEKVPREKIFTWK